MFLLLRKRHDKFLILHTNKRCTSSKREWEKKRQCEWKWERERKWDIEIECGKSLLVSLSKTCTNWKMPQIFFNIQLRFIENLYKNYKTFSVYWNLWIPNVDVHQIKRTLIDWSEFETNFFGNNTYDWYLFGFFFLWSVFVGKFSLTSSRRF